MAAPAALPAVVAAAAPAFNRLEWEKQLKVGDLVDVDSGYYVDDAYDLMFAGWQVADCAAAVSDPAARALPPAISIRLQVEMSRVREGVQVE